MFKPNESSHSYQLDRSISTKGLLGSIIIFITILIGHSVNSGDPDQTPWSAAYDLALHWLTMNHECFTLQIVGIC